MTSGPDQLQVALFWHDRCAGFGSTGGRRPERCKPAPPEPFLTWRAGGAGSVFEAIKRLARPLVRLLYLAPVLIVARAACYFMGLPGGDWITVGFVGLVVLFFALLAVLVLLYPIVGARSTRVLLPSFAPATQDVLKQVNLRGALIQADQLERLCEEGIDALPLPLRLKGRVLGTGPSDEERPPPIRDTWQLVDQQAVRLVTTRVFVLELDNGHVPVVVDPGGGLVLVGAPYAPGAGEVELESGLREQLGAWIRRESGFELSSIHRYGMTATIEEGAKVELVVAPSGSRVVSSVEDLAVAGRQLHLSADGSATAPYRGDSTRRGILIEGTADHPVIIRRL